MTKYKMLDDEGELLCMDILNKKARSGVEDGVYLREQLDERIEELIKDKDWECYYAHKVVENVSFNVWVHEIRELYIIDSSYAKNIVDADIAILRKVLEKCEEEKQ